MIARASNFILVHFGHLNPAMRAIIWMGLSGIVFAVLNAILRHVALRMNPLEVQFLRYLAGLIVMIPFMARVGLRAWSPNGIVGQLWRGAFHTSGMVLWYVALPHLTLAEMTAIGFTAPIFIMAGAVLALGEKMIWERWASAALCFAGVLIVVGPAMSGTGGYYGLVMLASSPLFAISPLITKVMTRRDKPEVILVWQCITISLFSLPLAIPVWVWPTTTQWLWFLASGVIGSTGHYCVNRALEAADATASQTVKFLDLLWMTALGFIVFGDLPTISTLIGGVVICGATTWVSRREAMKRQISIARLNADARPPGYPPTWPEEIYQHSAAPGPQGDKEEALPR